VLADGQLALGLSSGAPCGQPGDRAAGNEKSGARKPHSEIVPLATVAGRPLPAKR
jgi:hypothetical protein